MGIWNTYSEIFDSIKPWTVVEAEAPVAMKEELAVETKEKGDEEAQAEVWEKAEDEDEEKEKEEDEDEEDEDEDEEEDEEEIVDPKDTLEQECKESKQCAPVKHHYDDCVERVHQQESEGEAKEDCVEEFFHLAHCATACAAPKLWDKLK